MKDEKTDVIEFTPPNPMKHRRVRKSNNDEGVEITTLRQRVSELENLHPELTPRKPTPLYMIIIKWIIFFIIIGLFLYSLYLFYCYEQLGKNITIPFWGILRH